MSDCWVSKDVFDKINAQADPRSYWRKFLAVWPNWNSNGQSVVKWVNKYAKTKIDDNTKISFMDYNWNLNEQ